MIKKRIETEKLAEANKHATSIPTLPDHLKDLLTLDLSGVGQGDDAVRVNRHNADTCQSEPRVSGNLGGQVATESEVTATINLSQGGLMALSQKTHLSDKDMLTTTRSQSRVDALNASIARCQAKLKKTTGETKDALLGLLQRLQDELQILVSCSTSCLLKF